MSAPVEQVRAALAVTDAGIELRTFAQPVPTASAAAAALGCPVGAIANSLVFDASGDLVLVLASAGHRVDTAALAARLGVPGLRLAKPDRVFEQTGMRVGGVAPVGHRQALATVIDADLARFDPLWAGGGDEFTMFPISFERLVAVTAGRVLPVD